MKTSLRIIFVCAFMGFVVTDELAAQSKPSNLPPLPDDAEWDKQFEKSKLPPTFPCALGSIRTQLPDTAEGHRRCRAAQQAGFDVWVAGQARLVDINLVTKNAQNSGYLFPSYPLEFTNEPVINASAETGSNIIRLPLETVKFFIEDPAELAYVIAHEVGHIEDSNCHARGLE